MKKRWIILLAACTLCLTVGCEAKRSVEVLSSQVQEYTEEIQNEETEKKLMHSLVVDGINYLSTEDIPVPKGAVLAMVGKDSSSEYWEALEAGAKAAVEDLNETLGYTGSEKIELHYDAPEDEDIEEQITIIDQMVDESPQALCIGFVDVNSGSTQLEMAQANGIPVLTVDSGIEHELVRCQVQTNNGAAATKAALRFFNAMGGSGKMALLVHSADSQTGIEREQGVTMAVYFQSHMPAVQVAEIIYMQEEEADTLEEIRRVMEMHPDLTGWFGTNLDTTEFLLKAMEELESPGWFADKDQAERKEAVKVGGFDLGGELVEALEEGRLVGTMAQDPYAMGYAAIVAAAREAAGLPNVAQVILDSYWVTAENLEDPLIQSLIY